MTVAGQVLAVPGRLLDGSWKLLERFKYQNSCKEQYETHFPRHAFRIDFYMYFFTIFAPFGRLETALGWLLHGYGAALGKLGSLLAALGRLWAALGRLLGGSRAALGRLLVAFGRLLGQLVLFFQKCIKNLQTLTKQQHQKIGVWTHACRQNRVGRSCDDDTR